jgi:arylsulfatase A-like enzyme
VNRRYFLALPVAAAAQAPTLPNIVVIVADDLGYGDLSCYGASDIRTPNVDALAAAGMRFTHFYSNSPVCSPTRAALLTGRNPDLVGVPGVIRTNLDNSWGYLSSSATLLPEVLRRRGYRRAIVGKWHLGLQSPNTPTERGFNFFHGFLGDMMDDYYTHRRHGNNYMRRNLGEIDPKGHATDLFTEWAVEYLNERPAAPFLLYAAYNAPHTPIQPTTEWLGRVQARERNITEPRAKIAALIEHMDEGIGRIIAALKTNGQYENTLIVFTSDNGGQLNAGGTAGRLRGGKQDMYEGGIRVPSIVVWPNRVKAGTTSGLVAQSSDLLPTLCEAASVPTGPVDGVSILPSLLGKEQDLSGRTLYWVRREGGARYHGQEYYAVRRGFWKLLHNSPFEPLELYNLDEDPAEQRNVLKEQPKIGQQLTLALSKHIQRAGRVTWQPPANRI